MHQLAPLLAQGIVPEALLGHGNAKQEIWTVQHCVIEYLKNNVLGQRQFGRAQRSVGRPNAAGLRRRRQRGRCLRDATGARPICRLQLLAARRQRRQGGVDVAAFCLFLLGFAGRARQLGQLRDKLLECRTPPA